MAAPKQVTRQELERTVALYNEIGPKAAGLKLGIPTYKVEYRIECAIREGLLPGRQKPAMAEAKEHVAQIDGRLQRTLTDGYIIVGSDHHYYPGIVSTAHRAFLELCRALKPKIVVANGDVFDGSTISRHPRIGWDSKPSVVEELQCVNERLSEIEAAAGTRDLVWLLGNHDARYETFLASRVPEFQNVDGFTLKSHFPAWTPGWSLFINDDCVIKHRFKGGIHATHNNALWAGRTVVTGHLHSQRVTPLSDYNGTRWGVDCGTMAAPYGPQFQDYTEDNPKNWRSGFAVLRYWQGQLLEPQTVTVLDEEKGLVRFGLEVFKV